MPESLLQRMPHRRDTLDAANRRGWADVEIDLAFEWLERAEATNDSGLTDAITNPLMRNLHADPRWAAFLDRLRLD